MRVRNKVVSLLLAASMIITLPGNTLAQDNIKESVPVVETETEGVTENEAAAKETVEAQTESVVKKTVEAQTEPAAEETAEVQTESAAKETAEAQTEPAAEETAEAQNEPTAEETAEAQNEQTAKEMAETQAENAAGQMAAAEEAVSEKEVHVEKAAQSDVEQVKALIAVLPELPDISNADAGQIQAAQAAYDALTKQEQSELDQEPMDGGQPYGRVLETALWGLRALTSVNSATTLAAGSYDETTTPQLTSEYSKGKSTSTRERKWYVKNVTVDANHNAVAVIAVESGTYDYIRTNGAVFRKSNTAGANADSESEFAGVPIDLNSTFYIAAYSSMMKNEIAFSITSHIEEGASEPVEEVPLTGIALSEAELTIEVNAAHAPLQVSYIPKNTTYQGGVIWSCDKNEVVSINKNTGEFTGLSAGVAVISASAGGFTASCKVSVTAKRTEGEKQDDKPDDKQDGKTALTVSNKTAMFKAVDAYFETKNGKTVLYVTLNGTGYRELFVGSYQQAVDTGTDSSQWIVGKKRTDKTTLSYVETTGKTKTTSANGKLQFEIPVAKDVSYLQVQALSDTHKKDGYWWYPRQFVIDRKNNTMQVDDYHGKDPLQVSCTSNIVEITSAELLTEGGPHSNSYGITLDMVLAGSQYTKAYLGTKENAEANETDAFAVKKQTVSFIVEQILGTGNDAKIASRIGAPFALSLYDSTAKQWIPLELTINQKKGTLQVKTFDKNSQDIGNDKFEQKQEQAAQENSKTPDKNGNSTNSGTMPGTVDNSTSLADGTYSSGQFKFTYSGGSGRVVINCDKVEVKNGKAYATLTFSRSRKQGGSSNYDQLRANGQVYTGKNTFTIPVSLNKNNTIVGRTVAMSAPHWVEYTIFISLAEPGSKEESTADVTENKKVLDQELPTIMGLQGEQEIEVTYTDKLKIFAYKDGFYLIEVNMIKGSDRDTDAYLEFLDTLTKTSEQTEENALTETAAEDTTAGMAEDEEYYEEEGYEQIEYEEVGNEEAEGAMTAKGPADARSSWMFAEPVVKYLVVPEGQEVPAGLEKDLVIISQPCARTYVSSLSAVELLQELDLTAVIDTVGFDREELEAAGFTALAERMELPETDEAYAAWGGAYDAPEFRTLLMRKTDLLVSCSNVLPADIDNPQEEMDALLQLGERCMQLGTALWIDRSGDEDNALAKAEWYQAYGIIFGCREQAKAAYQKVVAAASAEEKEAALAALK